jgi:tRNA nucleotidyltransferase (CCA-adding enzyme)
MNGSELSAKLRDYVKSRVSPTLAERELVAKLYAAVREALGDKCYLVGSFARFTASRPMHDIDVVFVSGDFEEDRLNPSSTLNWLHSEFREHFSHLFGSDIL